MDDRREILAFYLDKISDLLQSVDMDEDLLSLYCRNARQVVELASEDREKLQELLRLLDDISGAKEML